MPQVSQGDLANFEPIFVSGLTMVVDFIAKATGKTPAREEFEGLTWAGYQFGKTITAAQYQLCWASLQGVSRRVAGWQQPYAVETLSSDLERYLSQSRPQPSSASGGFEHLRRFPAVVIQQG
jgi:hypothetical protein